MPFIIISSKGVEVARRALAGGVTIGRAPDCDLAIHDILLSRHHCRIEPSGRGWVVLDLRSKNGTWLDGERVGRRSLRHAEIVRTGNTTLRFMMGDLPPDAERPRAPKRQPRPADPFEAMAGTVVDFDPGKAEDDDERSRSRTSARMPYPRPMPREPASYARDGVYSLLEQIASSSWDSIYANASRPTRLEPAMATMGDEPAQPERPLKRPALPTRPRPPSATAIATPAPNALPFRSRRHVDLSLQAPAIRAPRAGRRPLPALGPVPPPRRPTGDSAAGSLPTLTLSSPLSPLDALKPSNAPTIPALSRGSRQRKSILRWALRSIIRPLASARSKIAPRGAIMLF